MKGVHSLGSSAAGDFPLAMASSQRKAHAFIAGEPRGTLLSLFNHVKHDNLWDIEKALASVLH